MISTMGLPDLSLRFRRDQPPCRSWRRRLSAPRDRQQQRARESVGRLLLWGAWWFVGHAAIGLPLRHAAVKLAHSGVCNSLQWAASLRRHVAETLVYE